MAPTHSKARNVHRLPACAALGALALACRDATGPLQPADVVGTYALRSTEGHTFPWADTSATDSSRSQLIFYSDRLTLGADGTAVDRGMVGNRSDPQPRPDVGTYQWVLNPDGQVNGSDFVRLRWSRTTATPGPLYTDFYYRVEDGGRRLVATGTTTTWAGPYPADVYTR